MATPIGEGVRWERGIQVVELVTQLEKVEQVDEVEKRGVQGVELLTQLKWQHSALLSQQSKIQIQQHSLQLKIVVRVWLEMM